MLRNISKWHSEWRSHQSASWGDSPGVCGLFGWWKHHSWPPWWACHQAAILIFTGLPGVLISETLKLIIVRVTSTIILWRKRIPKTLLSACRAVMQAGRTLFEAASIRQRETLMFSPFRTVIMRIFLDSTVDQLPAVVLLEGTDESRRWCSLGGRQFGSCHQTAE